MSPVWVEDVPKPAQDGRGNLLKCVKFTGTEAGVCKDIEMQTCLLLEYLKKREPDGNVQRVLNEMMLVSFKESSQQNILDVFQGGIYCRGKSDQRYHFLGHSRKQLKNKMCFLIRKSPEQIYDILADFADFQQVEPIEKRADQIGALFSCFTHSKRLREDEFDVIDSVQKPQGESPKMSEAIRSLFDPSPVPSVMQARCQASRGTLLHTKGKVLFTRSMETLEVKEFPDILGIMDYSKPYSMGYIDTLSRMILEERGVEPDYMERLQTEYHKHLESITEDADLAKWFLSRIGKLDLSTDLAAPHGARNNVEEILQEVRKIKDEGIFSDSDSKEGQKDRVLVLKSREVFGVRDPYSHLKSNECFFNPTLPNEEEKDFKSTENLLIMHRPCYNADHICRLKLVHKSDVRAADYEDIQDCLVLSCSGVLEEKSWKYFVCWDENLIPSALPSVPISTRCKSYFSSPALPRIRQWMPNLPLCHLINDCAFSSCFGLCQSSSSPAAEAQRKTKQRYLLLDFFASFGDLFSKAEELFMTYASADGPSSDRCRRLSDLLCGGIDPYTQTEEAKRVIMEVQRMDNAEDHVESDAEEQDESAPLIA